MSLPMPVDPTPTVASTINYSRKALIYRSRWNHSHPWICALPDGNRIYATTWQKAMDLAHQAR